MIVLHENNSLEKVLWDVNVSVVVNVAVAVVVSVAVAVAVVVTVAVAVVVTNLLQMQENGHIFYETITKYKN